MTFTEYQTRCYQELRIRGKLRHGQVLFNVLFKCRQDLAVSLTGTEFDPFYDDRNVPSFLQKVEELWETKEK